MLYTLPARLRHIAGHNIELQPNKSVEELKTIKEKFYANQRAEKSSSQT